MSLPPGSWAASSTPCFWLPGTSPADCAWRLMSCSVPMTCKASLSPSAQHLCLMDGGPGATEGHKPERGQCISSRPQGRLCFLLFGLKYETRTEGSVLVSYLLPTSALSELNVRPELEISNVFRLFMPGITLSFFTCFSF